MRRAAKKDANHNEIVKGRMITTREFLQLQVYRPELSGFRAEIYAHCRQLHSGITTRRIRSAFPKASRWAVWWNLYGLVKDGYLRVTGKGGEGKGLGRLLTYEVA